MRLNPMVVGEVNGQHARKYTLQEKRKKKKNKSLLKFNSISDGEVCSGLYYLSQDPI